MSIKDRLVSDMKEAMKAREEGKARLAVIRMVRAAIKNAEIEKKEPLDDSETAKVIMREIKQRKESLPEYEKAGRTDMVESLQEEIRILQEYLPEQLTEEEIQSMAEQIIAQTGASGPKDIGKVMGPLMEQTKGRAEGKVVNSVVRRLLGG